MCRACVLTHRARRTPISNRLFMAIRRTMMMMMHIRCRRRTLQSTIHKRSSRRKKRRRARTIPTHRRLVVCTNWSQCSTPTRSCVSHYRRQRRRSVVPTRSACATCLCVWCARVRFAHGPFRTSTHDYYSYCATRTHTGREWRSAFRTLSTTGHITRSSSPPTMNTITCVAVMPINTHLPILHIAERYILPTLLLSLMCFHI